MSLLTDLTAEIGTASEHLPLPALRQAVQDVRAANAHLVRAIRAGAPIQPSLARLGASASHLENGAGLIMRAQDSLRDYTLAIGAPTFEPRSGVVAPAGEADRWWQRRVGELTGESAPAADDPARSAADLLVRVDGAVSANDRVGLHRQLVGAGAGLGSSLAGLASAALTKLVNDVLGHAPTAADVQSLRANAGVAHLLPGLPPAVLPAVLDRRSASHPSDPTALAIGTAVIAARLAHALGRRLEQAADA
ncbi:MAG TPA: hypothetical protein VGJ28_15650 [Micromonosporaceae bacterium]|jgi:hypothetical protein